MKLLKSAFVKVRKALRPKYSPDEAKKLWSDALRSGDYKQTKGTLKRVDYDTGKASYCCLGVACELYQKYGPGDLTVERDNDIETTSYDGNSGRPPMVVCNWLGMTTNDGSFQDYYDSVTNEDGLRNPTNLIACNDGHGFDFRKIADIVDKANFQVKGDWYNTNNE